MYRSIKKYLFALLLTLVGFCCTKNGYTQINTYALVDTFQIRIGQPKNLTQLHNLIGQLSEQNNLDNEKYLFLRLDLAFLLHKYGAPEHSVRIFKEIGENPALYLPYKKGSWYHRNIANHYLANDQFKQAIKHHKQALKERLKESNEPGTQAFIINDLGITYYRSGNLNKAYNTFKHASNIIQEERSDDKNFLARIQDNLGIIYLDWGMPDSAQRLFTLNKTYVNPEQVHKIIQADIRIASCYVQKRQFDLAEQILNQALLETNAIEQHRMNLYTLLLDNYLDLAIARRDIRLQAIVLRRSLEYQKRMDEINQEVSTSFLKQMEQILSKTWALKLEAKESELKEERALTALSIQKERVTYQRYLILVLAVLSITIILAIYFSARSRKFAAKITIDELNKRVIATKLENEQLKSKRLNEHLDQKKQDLVDASLEINRRQKWLEGLQDRLESDLGHINESRHIRTIINDLKMQIVTDEKKQVFFSQIEVVNRNFYKKLRETFPKITSKELELCGLLRLNMSNKEIALYRSVAPDSIKTARKRLRKKLQLQSDVDIRSFLQNI